MGPQNTMGNGPHTQSDRVDGSPASEESESIDCNANERRNASLGSTRSTPTRFHTRLQTGIILKRRLADDTDFYAEQKEQATTVRKKPKVYVTNEQVDTRTQSCSSSGPKLPLSRHPSLGSVSTTFRDPPSVHQINLWHVSPASDDQHELEPRSRSRARLPTPIPNLTKKSRGRRVPTQGSSQTTDQKEARLFVCQVKDCGKCFHRGEHLKRHIRSIHTHEKPFQCTYPECEKYFNRHDNLLQHLKVHREPHERPTLPSLRILPRQYLGEVQVCTSQRAESPLDEPESPASPLSAASPRSIHRQIPSNPYHANSALYTVPAEPTSLITNMAVSSLRTVLPHSPTENNMHSMQPSPCQCRS